MPADPIHHIGPAKVLEKYTFLFNTIYAGQGGRFGMTDDFSGRVQNLQSHYDKLLAQGDGDRLIALDAEIHRGHHT